MSLSVGLGQCGFALGGTLAGMTYARYGYLSNTMLSEAFLLVTAFIIWRFLPEPSSEVTATDDRLRSAAAGLGGETVSA